MNGARSTFGPRLRLERERRGITLESIAGSTKIKVSLLAGLECGDVSRWPNGIFRRAWMRNYAHTVGLDPGPLVAEFLRLFPEPGTVVDAETSPAAEPSKGAPLRLSLAVDPRDQFRRLATRVLTAAGEACAVLLAAAIVTFLSGVAFWTVCALVALAYYPLASACSGRSTRLGELPATCRRVGSALIERAHEARRRRMYLVPSTQAAQRPASASSEADEEFSRRRTAAS